MPITRARLRHYAFVEPEPTWPVFCLDGGDVIVVGSAADIPIALDPVLVDEPVKLIDSKGRRLRKVVSTPPPKKHWWSIPYAPEIVGVAVDDGDDSVLLRETLTTYLTASGLEVHQSEDLETFARAAAAQIR